MCLTWEKIVFQFQVLALLPKTPHENTMYGISTKSGCLVFFFASLRSRRRHRHTRYGFCPTSSSLIGLGPLSRNEALVSLEVLFHISACLWCQGLVWLQWNPNDDIKVADPRTGHSIPSKTSFPLLPNFIWGIVWVSESNGSNDFLRKMWNPITCNCNILRLHHKGNTQKRRELSMCHYSLSYKIISCPISISPSLSLSFSVSLSLPLSSSCRNKPCWQGIISLSHPQPSMPQQQFCDIPVDSSAACSCRGITQFVQSHVRFASCLSKEAALDRIALGLFPQTLYWAIPVS